MPQNPPTRRRRSPSSGIRPTISLPSLPPTRSRPQSSTGRQHPPSRDEYGAASEWDEPRAESRPRALVRVDSAPVPSEQELHRISRSLPAAARRSLPMRVVHRPPPPPLWRTLLWQGILVAVIVGVFITSLQTSLFMQNKSATFSAFQATAAQQKAEKVVDRVPTLIQLDPTIGWKSPQQYDAFANAACGAASSSAALQAWGIPNTSIGQVIEDMGPYISSYGGIMGIQAFQNVAKAHDINVTITSDITPAQLAQIVSVQGIPVVIGVKDSYGGYYRYFAPGHYLVVTGADANGFKIVDSSTYFVHYLPTDTFVSLWVAPKAIIYYPKTYNFQMP